MIEFAEVLFYFSTTIGGELQALALVSLYSKPDLVLYEESYWTVYSVTQLAMNEGLHVVNTKSILSVVSVQPHQHHVEEGDTCFFIWEQLGLDMSLTGPPEDENIE